jgi:hypothetical protein
MSTMCGEPRRCWRWPARVHFIHAAREAGLRSGTTVADLVVRFNRHGLAAVGSTDRQLVEVDPIQPLLMALGPVAHTRRLDALAQQKLAQPMLGNCLVVSTRPHQTAQRLMRLVRYPDCGKVTAAQQPRPLGDLQGLVNFSHRSAE